MPLRRSLSMVHPTPTKVLLTTTLRPLVTQLSGSLAHGVRLLDQFLHDEPTPQQMAKFEWELRTLLREVGRRIMAWVLHHMEPENHAEAPSRLWWKGEAYRRRRKHRTTIRSNRNGIRLGSNSLLCQLVT
jgi:hypothetical protein